VRGREFGEGLRAAVKRSTLSGREIAGMLGWDQGKLSDLLGGKGGSTELEIVSLLGVCRTPAPERDHLLKLFREARGKGWWQQHGSKLPINQRTLVEHERIATVLIVWQMNLIPGLLQTPDYMRALMRASANFPKTEVEARVAARLARQEVFYRRIPCTFYLHEQALRLPVGGTPVLVDQLHHLLRMSVRPYIDVRIVRTTDGAHAGLAGSFTWFDFHKIEPVVFLESENSSLFMEDQPSIKGYKKVIESLDRSALDAEQSRRLITELAT